MIAWIALFLGASAMAWHIGSAIAWWRMQVRVAARAAWRERTWDHEKQLIRQWRPSLRGLGIEARAAAIGAHAASLPDTDLLAHKEFGTQIWDSLPSARRAAIEQKVSRRG